MSWTSEVKCAQCGGNTWRVQGGVWTCDCGKPMTTAEIAKFHALERGYEKLAAQQDTDEERAMQAARRDRRDRNRQLDD